MLIKFTNIGKENIQIAKTITQSYIQEYLNASRTFIYETRIIVGELISNAVIHSESTFIELELLHNQDRLFITVKDNGLGIDDIEEAKKPVYSIKGNEKKVRSGFLMVNALSDTFEIENDSGTIVKVSKRVK